MQSEIQGFWVYSINSKEQSINISAIEINDNTMVLYKNIYWNDIYEKKQNGFLIIFMNI